MCKQAVAVKVDDPDNIDNQQKITYTWQEVTNPAQLSTALMVALPSELASYYEDLGFTLLDGRLKVETGTYQSTKRQANKSKSRGEGSRQQSYQEHIYGLVQAYNWNISRELQYMADQLERKMGLPSAMVDQAIRLAIACHDLGKLDRTWQR
jgi:CRISPR-associated endonuclease/helicase Cas3